MFEIFHDEKLGKQDKIKKEWMGDEEVETISGVKPLKKFGHELKWERGQWLEQAWWVKEHVFTNRDLRGFKC